VNVPRVWFSHVWIVGPGNIFNMYIHIRAMRFVNCPFVSYCVHSRFTLGSYFPAYFWICAHNCPQTIASELGLPWQGVRYFPGDTGHEKTKLIAREEHSSSSSQQERILKHDFNTYRTKTNTHKAWFVLWDLIQNNIMWPLMEAFCVTLLRQSTLIYIIMNLTYVI
jgi:hypothetical protein